MMLMSARFVRVAAESRLAKPPHSGARPRRPPYHLHAFCTAPARTLVAVLGDGSRLAGGICGMVRLRHASAFFLRGQLRVSVAHCVGGRPFLARTRSRRGELWFID